MPRAVTIFAIGMHWRFIRASARVLRRTAVASVERCETEDQIERSHEVLVV